MIQVSRIQNLVLLIPKIRPLDAPCECLMVQCEMEGLKEFKVLVRKFSFFCFLYAYYINFIMEKKILDSATFIS